LACKSEACWATAANENSRVGRLRSSFMLKCNAKSPAADWQRGLQLD
jgi:hypothetical protein